MEESGKYVSFMSDRHYFVNLRKSIIVIQRAIRAWIAQRHCKASTSCNQRHKPDLINASIVIQSCIHGWRVRSVYAQSVTTKERSAVISEDVRVDECQTIAAIIIQQSWKNYVLSKSIQSQHLAATIIQSHYRGWSMRKMFACKKQAIRKIQRNFRWSRSRRYFQIQQEENASIIIQSHVRGWMARRKAYREKDLLIRIQVLVSECLTLSFNYYTILVSLLNFETVY